MNDRQRPLTTTFIRLKVTLLRNSLRRSSRGTWQVVGTWVAIIGAILCGIGGFASAVSLRSGWSEVRETRFLILGCAAILFGWWFGPILSGGADETLDPRRLTLLPLSRSQLRRGQIAAGFVGPAPLMVTLWAIGLVIGTAGAWWTLPFSIATSVVMLLAALVGSRAIATTLAVMTRSRRGGDIATMIAVIGAAALFAAFQAIQFVDEETVADATRIIRVTPLGWVGESFLAAAEGEVWQSAWRIVATAGLVAVMGWWWSRQLDRLLLEADVRNHHHASTEQSDLPIFDGWRARLPKSPSGAALARELVYLRRSPGRRAAVLSSLILGFVYVALLAARGQLHEPNLVLISPLAMVFALQYASNQLGVDPASFWVEVAAGPPAAARWVGRQALGTFSVMTPVVITALVLAVISGGWAQFAITLTIMLGAAPALIGIGSWISPPFATPVPDNGNPFGNRQSMQGTGCIAGLSGIVYLFVVAVLIGGPELALLWAMSESNWLASGLIVAATFALDGLLWWVTTRSAIRTLQRDELVVLDRLDSRLNA